MTFISKAIVDFSHYKEKEIGKVAGIIGNSLTTNAGDFPGLTFTGAQILSKTADYMAILGKPIYASRTADLANERKIMEDALHTNGMVVNTVANGDEVLLAKSGYPVTHPPVHHGALEKGRLTAKPTENAGEIEFEIEGVLHAKGYLVCYTLSSDTETDPHNWKWLWSPKSKGILSGLNYSAEYKLAATGLGTDPSVSFSDIIKRTTQGNG